MINPTYLLTEEDYNDLLKVQTQPDIILRQTNDNLKTQVDKLTKQLAEGSFESCTVDSPFRVIDDVLSMSSITDFVILYNFLAKQDHLSILSQADTSAFNYITQLADTFNYTCYFKSVSELKKYRVSLQKKQLFTNVKRDGAIKLIKCDQTKDN